MKNTSDMTTLAVLFKFVSDIAERKQSDMDEYKEKEAETNL